MSRVRLKLLAEPPSRIDARALSPTNLAGFSEQDIANLPLPMGRSITTVSDWFCVEDLLIDDTPNQLTLDGNCRRFDNIGYQMDGGLLSVIGDVGNTLGRGLRSGEVSVHGTVGHHAAMSMRGGSIEIAGNAGDHLGVPAPGERSGMSGGQVIVLGNAGTHLGQRLRRGTIIVVGDVGDFAATDMVAGSIIVAGQLGQHAAIGMRRGTLLLAHPPLLSAVGFTKPRVERSSFLNVLLDSLDEFEWNTEIFETISSDPAFSPMRSIGDLANGGMGEVIWFESR